MKPLSRIFRYSWLVFASAVLLWAAGCITIDVGPTGPPIERVVDDFPGESYRVVGKVSNRTHFPDDLDGERARENERALEEFARKFFGGRGDVIVRIREPDGSMSWVVIRYLGQATPTDTASGSTSRME